MPVPVALLASVYVLDPPLALSTQPEIVVVVNRIAIGITINVPTGMVELYVMVKLVDAVAVAEPTAPPVPVPLNCVIPANAGEATRQNAVMSATRRFMAITYKSR